MEMCDVEYFLYVTLDVFSVFISTVGTTEKYVRRNMCICFIFSLII